MWNLFSKRSRKNPKSSKKSKSPKATKKPPITSREEVDTSLAIEKTLPVSVVHTGTLDPSQATVGTSAQHETDHRPSSPLKPPSRTSHATGHAGDAVSKVLPSASQAVLRLQGSFNMVRLANDSDFGAPPSATTQATPTHEEGQPFSDAGDLLASSTLQVTNSHECSEPTVVEIPSESSLYPIGESNIKAPDFPVGSLPRTTGRAEDNEAFVPSPSRERVPGPLTAYLSPGSSFQENRIGSSKRETWSDTQIDAPNSYFEGAHNLTIGTLAPTTVGRDQVHYTTNIYRGGVSMEERNLDRLRDEIRKWLKAPSCREIHATAIDQRTENTGTWFLNSDEFQKLKNDSGCVLWCTGMPGSGKTILASTSIEHLEDSFKGDANVAIIYMYLRYSEKRTLAEVFLTLLDQLLDHDAAVVKIAPGYHEKLRRRTGCTSERDTLRFLKEALSCMIKIFAVIDGLDEAAAEVRDGLLQALPSTDINILIFSRPLDPYAHHTPSAIQVSIQARTNDIALYIDEQFNKNSRLRSLLGNRPDLVVKLSNRIKEQANGMFLLARIQLESAMCSSSSPKSLFDSLEKLPSGIDEMYRLTLERINGQSEQIVSLVHRLLVWLLYQDKGSKARLDTIGMQYALAVDPDTNMFDEDDISPEGLILSVCHGLVATSKVDSVRREFRFIHYSAEEFARKLQFQAIPNPHSYIAATCIGYLDSRISLRMHPSDEFSGGSPDYFSAFHFPHRADLTPASYPSLGYALVSWGYHARLSQREQGGLPPCVLSFLSRYPSYPMYEGKLDEVYMIPSLSIAAMHGLVDIITTKTLDFPDPDHNPDQSPPFPMSPFHIAAHNDHFDAFIALISTYGMQGHRLWTHDDNFIPSILDVVLARVSRSYYDRDKPATAAPFLRQLLAVLDNPPTEDARLCLEGFDINAQCYNGRTLLVEACRLRDEDTVRILVERRNIQVDLRDATGLSALDTAIQHWTQSDRFRQSPDVPLVLVSSIPSLDLGKPDAAGDTPFIEACRAGHERLVRFILTSWPNDRDRLLHHTNHRGMAALTVVIVSARRAHDGEDVKIIHLLLHHGSDLDTKEVKFGFTPFLQAVVQHCADDRTIGPNPTDSLELLLSFDSSIISQRDKEGRTALMLAAMGSGCHPAFVIFLLSHARPPHSTPAQFLNARDNGGCTALMHAIHNYDGSRSRVAWAHVPPHVLWNRVEVVKALLSHPALDVCMLDRLGRGILEFVCSNKTHRGTTTLPAAILFLMLYAILDVESGWDARLVRRAVIAGVRDLQEVAVYRLLLERWVIYSFTWTLDDPDTITLLLQVSARKSKCRAVTSIVLYHLGLLGPPLFPRGLDISDHELLGKAFCRKSVALDALGDGQDISEERGDSESGSEFQDPSEDRRSLHSGSGTQDSSEDDQSSSYSGRWSRPSPRGPFDWDNCQCVCDSGWSTDVVLQELFANRRTFAISDLEKMIHKSPSAPVS